MTILMSDRKFTPVIAKVFESDRTETPANVEILAIDDAKRRDEAHHYD
jgi:hypothetical protein